MTRESLTISQVTRTIGPTEILKGISLSAGSKDFLVLLGPSGCGKSTLLNLIAGFDQPTSGEILIDGQNMVDTPPSERDIAMVFQSYALYPSMTVRENMGFCLKMRKVKREEADRHIKIAKKKRRESDTIDHVGDDKAGRALHQLETAQESRHGKHHDLQGNKGAEQKKSK